MAKSGEGWMKNLKRCIECFSWYEIIVEEVKGLTVMWRNHNSVAGLCEKEGGR